MVEVVVAEKHALQIRTETGLAGLLNAEAGVLAELPTRDPKADDTCRELRVWRKVIPKHEKVQNLPDEDVRLLKYLAYLQIMGCFRRFEGAEGVHGRWDVSYLAKKARAAADVMFMVSGSDRILGAAPLAADAASEAPNMNQSEPSQVPVVIETTAGAGKSNGKYTKPEAFADVRALTAQHPAGLGSRLQEAFQACHGQLRPKALGFNSWRKLLGPRCLPRHQSAI